MIGRADIVQNVWLSYCHEMEGCFIEVTEYKQFVCLPMQKSSLARTEKDAAEAQARLAESSVRELHATKLALQRGIAVKSLLLQSI